MKRETLQQTLWKFRESQGYVYKSIFHQMGKPKEMYRFLDCIYNLLKLNKNEVSNLNRPSKEIRDPNLNIQRDKSSG